MLRGTHTLIASESREMNTRALWLICGGRPRGLQLCPKQPLILRPTAQLSTHFLLAARYANHTV